MSPTSEIYDVRCTTIVLQMTNRLFDKHLLPNKFTWSGRSPLGERIAFKKYVNIIKLIHAVLLVFVPSAKLADVETLLNKKILKHAVARAKGTDTRESTGRVFTKKQDKKQKTNETSGNDDDTVDSAEKDNEDTEASADDSSGTDSAPVAAGSYVKKRKRNRSIRQLTSDDEANDEEEVDGAEEEQVLSARRSKKTK